MLQDHFLTVAIFILILAGIVDTLFNRSFFTITNVIPIFEYNTQLENKD